MTVADLAKELDVSIGTAAGLVADAGAPHPTDWYGTDVIAPGIVSAIRQAAVPVRDTLAAFMDRDTVLSEADLDFGVRFGRRSGTTKAPTAAQGGQWDVIVPMPLPDLVQIASLLLRADMALVDAAEQDQEYPEADASVLDWALATAGHLFDHHVLWDYDLVSDADHFPRCTGYRHLDRTLKDLGPDRG